MIKNLLLTLTLILVVTLSFGVAFGEGIPTLTLTVEKSPLDVWPPAMIYTAKLSIPPPSNTSPCDFYNAPEGSSVWTQIGSAAFDRNGVAKITVQMNPGAYQSVAKTMVYGTVISSNIVHYKVP